MLLAWERDEREREGWAKRRCIFKIIYISHYKTNFEFNDIIILSLVSFALAGWKVDCPGTMINVF